MAYTFDLIPPAENDTSVTNVTMVRVNIADVLPKKSGDGEIQYSADIPPAAIFDICTL